MTEPFRYQTPPDVIQQLVDVPSIPGWRLSPDRQWVVVSERPGLPDIELLTREELKLAGIRFDPRTFGPSKSSYATGLRLRTLRGDIETEVANLPENPKITVGNWTADSRYLFFKNTTESGIELWRLDAEQVRAEQILGPVLHQVTGGSYGLPFGKNILIYKRRPLVVGPPPERPRVPVGPVVQVSEGTQSPVRTHQDLLRDEHDEALFEYYMRCEIWSLDLETREEHRLLPADLYTALSGSPDGNYFTLRRIKRPFSYLFPAGRFPFEINIYHTDGSFVAPLSEASLADDIPQGFGAVRRGPREFTWRSDCAASLYWVEALDGGDPRREAEERDALFRWSAPFDRAPEPVMNFNLRYAGILWGNDDLAICSEYRWRDRRVVQSKWSPGAERPVRTTIVDRVWEDRYKDPGEFETIRNQYNRAVLYVENNRIYRTGSGFSEEGKRPFLDCFNFATGETERLWRSEAPYYEYPSMVMNHLDHTLLTVRESRTENPNYFLRNWKTGELTRLSNFPDVFAPLREVPREVIRYQREDGVELSGTLYLPTNFTPGTSERLPVLMWAYPREYKSATNAGQRTDSPYEYTTIHPHSPLFWVLRGYAVFDNFSMPIVGEGDEEPNETFVDQLRASARAAIHELDRREVVDRNRIAVGGHSYGAFMTANLLAHTDLFAAGIARSGAYNRTLTPFGFQSEERTLWEAGETYLRMSPFMHADKIESPLLLIHGKEDPNSGTYPMQSERLFAAVKGMGKICRLVLLPEEGHGYRARESMLHMLWEMDQWLERYV